MLPYRSRRKADRQTTTSTDRVAVECSLKVIGVLSAIRKLAPRAFSCNRKRANNFSGASGAIQGVGGEFPQGGLNSFTEVLGQEGRYNNVSPEAYRGFGFPGADDLGNMFQFKRDFEDYYSSARNPDFARSLNPSLQNFKMWLTQNKNAISLNDAAANA
jgi:hypothetical protein